MKVLVTGAGGMAGSHLAEKLFERGDKVTGLYHKNKVNISQIKYPVTFISCDIRYGKGIDNIIMDCLPEEIYHLAAQSYPSVSWKSPYETIDVNINGTAAVFEAVKSARKYVCPGYDPVIVVACSSAEYGAALEGLQGDRIFVKETAELKPLHPYGVSKAGQDMLSYQYFINDHIRSVRARIFNSTGTRKVNDVTSDFTFRAVEAEKSGKYEIRVGNLDTKRAIMDQRDLIRALMLLAEKGTAGEVYNVSSEHIYQMRDIVVMIEQILGHKLNTVTDEALCRPSDEKIIAGDISRLKKDTGWVQEIPMQQTVADMMEYWRKTGFQPEK